MALSSNRNGIGGSRRLGVLLRRRSGTWAVYPFATMAVETPPPELGAACPSFRLPAVDGKTYARDDFAAVARALRDVHLQPLPVRQGGRGPDHSPGARLRGARACRWSPSARTTPKATPTTPSTSSAPRWREKEYGFPYLHDETQEVARAFGAVCTPDIFVYDRAPQARLPGAHRRLLERREQGDATRARRGARGAGERPGALRPTTTVDGMLDQMATAEWHDREREQDTDGGAHQRAPGPQGALACLPRAQGAEDHAAARGDRRRVPALSGHVALEDLLSSARRKHPQRGPGDRLPHRQAAGRGGDRRGAPLRPRPDAVRGGRGAGPPRSPDLRRLRASSSSSRATRSSSCRTTWPSATASTCSATATSCSACARRPAGSPAAPAPPRLPAGAVARNRRRSVSRRRARVGVF